MQKGDRVNEIVLDVLHSAKTPLETREILDLVQVKIPTCTRTILLRRLHILRGDALIKGKTIGSGKGVWIWWVPNSFNNKSGIKSEKVDKVVDKIIEILDDNDVPLETKEIENLVRNAIPSCTRSIIFRRLNVLRGDGAIEGKYLGSGKGVWIWWRLNAFEE